MTTSDKTPMIFEQRCNQGHLHVYVVPRYVAQYMLQQYPNCTVANIDQELLNEASAIVDSL